MNIIDKFYAILDKSCNEKTPDIHLNTGHKPIIRSHNGGLITLDEILIQEEEKDQEGNIIKPEEILLFETFSKEDISQIIKNIAGEEGFNKFIENFELDTSFKYKDKDRFRVNCYIDTAGYSIALRIIPSNIPSLETLGLGDGIKEMCKKSKGLVLVTGPTGSGKSTNLAAMIDFINSNYNKHIITIEDPVEFAFESKKSLINQREIGNNTKGFPEAIRASLRQDPDIIMVGEMRDPETIKAAITLAETGHLVFSTLHTNDTVQSIDRIVDVFPSGQQDQVRMQLAMSLVGIISQRLLPRVDNEGRIPAREILVANDATRNLIISGKTHQIYSVLEVSSKHGMILMDKYLVLLYKKGLISKETMLTYARDTEGIEMLIE